MLIRRILPALSLLVLAACGDDAPPTTVTGLNGALTFTFSGAGGGTFNVSGTMPTIQANIGNNDWAAGYRDTDESGFSVGGVRARGSGRYDLFSVFAQRLTVGTSTIDANCDGETTACTGLAFIRNVSEADEDFDFICFATTGSIAITEITNTRIKGTFSGSGSCFNDALTESSFSVSGGTFDVPLVSNLPV